MIKSASDRRIVPKKLVEGDQVRVIAPSRSLKIIAEENIKHAVRELEALGLKVTFGKNVNEVDMMSSSSIASRVKDLHEAFSDKSVKAILTVIGGFKTGLVTYSGLILVLLG